MCRSLITAWTVATLPSELVPWLAFSLHSSQFAGSTWHRSHPSSLGPLTAVPMAVLRIKLGAKYRRRGV